MRCVRPPPPGGRVRRFIRARLQRRIFVWFGATILVTVGLVFGVMHLVEGTGSSTWRQEVARIQALTSRQFARVWDDPIQRDELAREVAEDLDVGVELVGRGGERLSAHGAPCGPRAFRIPVRRRGEEVGAVAVCLQRYRAGGPLRVFLPLAVIVGALWAASGIISRRLARPLSELARVAGEIGEGKLGSRVSLDRHHADEVGVVAETVNDMAARIEKQLADQRELLAAVSHELRTPLARIRLITEMARDGGASSRLLDDLDREVVEIDALVGDLLASSRLDFNALTLSRLSPAEIATRAVERAGLDPSLLEVEEGVPSTIEADATLLARALANLIENARAHGGGAERLRVRPEGEGIAFEVEDRGSGFAEDDIGRAFEPFYRGDRARGAGEPRGSLGLGLALCKRVAEAHRGRAFAENRDGGGARVGIVIATGRGPA